MMIRLIICAAMRNKNTGIVVCGARHGDCLNLLMNAGIDKNPDGDVWEMGFIDQNQIFLSRAEAWKVADAAGQIRRPTTWERDYSQHRVANVGDDGLLFSENLY